MENRFLVQINNESEHTFVYDGEWIRSGDWKSDRQAVIAAHSLTNVEFESTNVKGVAGIVWWTDAAQHNVYLSITIANPRLQTASFFCAAGIPPHDLKAELDAAPRLCQGKDVGPDGAGCRWNAAAIGSLTVVKLTIFAELQRYVPPSVTSFGGASSSTSPADDDKAGESASPCSEQQPAVECTALASMDKNGDGKIVETEEEAREALQKFMAQTRPKDAIDGLSKGFKTAGAMVVAGVGNIVHSTVQGYQQGKALGVLKGLGTGVVGGAVIAVGGTACGVAQVTRGFVNTPAALRGRREQRVWDQELGRWVDINLIELEHQVELEGSDDESCGGATSSGGTEVAETEYYDLLKISPSAPPSEVKKAYYREAKQCHPDKNPGDMEAKVKFQKLADAYQVLSSPEARKKYDKEGKAGVQGDQLKMDASIFFSVLFGSERFEPWVGELHLAMQTDQFAKTLEREVDERTMEETIQDGEEAAKALKRRQLRREVRCACHLRDKLDRYVHGRDPQGFEEQMRLEAVDLANGQFGPELLIALGEIYSLRAEIYLADELVGRFSFTKRVAAMKHSGVTMRHRLRLFQNTAGSIMSVKRVHDAAKGVKAREGEEQEEELRKAMEGALENALPTFLQTAWAAVVTDIDGTIKEVGRKLLKDKSVSWQIRLRRAQALQFLGRILYEEGMKESQNQGDTASRVMTSEAAKATLQEALMGSVREQR